METGLGVLGLAPAVFWSLTPRELQAILRGKFGASSEGAAPTRVQLDALMRQYPDSEA
ncbi:MAG: phage tail assembly chaperone [Hyphomicrobium denitrificans]|nr:phage tail assembly chaperone [Hyphomicrobium denitrificans]